MLRRITLILLLATVGISTAQNSNPIDAGFAPSDADRSYWGWNLGGVFSDIPISEAIDNGFAVFMANLYYGHYLTDPNEKFRTAFSLGVYGFQLILPVPVIGMDVFVGKPNQDLQFKGSIGGFYDITVGGHAGMALGAGVLLKNSFNVSLFMVPFGKDADRDYLNFVGSRDEALNCNDADVDCVNMPYFGLFAGFQY